MRFTLKSALMLAVILLVASVPTYAQFVGTSSATFTASAANPQVRDAGITEPVGDVVLSAVCSAPTSLVVPGNGTATATLSITFNGTITNPATTPGTVVTNPTGAPITLQNATTPGISVTFNNIVGVQGAAGAATATIPAPVAGTTSLGWNVVGSTLNITFTVTGGTGDATAGPSALVIGTACTGGIPGGVATLQVHGVRVNTSGIAAGSTVQAFVTSSPSNVVFLSGFFNPITVATVAPTLNATRTVVRTGTGGSGPVNFTNCGIASPPSSFPGTSSTTTNLTGAIFTVRVTEGFVNDFTTNAQEGAKTNALEVTNGTRIMLQLTGLPTSVILAVPQVVQGLTQGTSLPAGGVFAVPAGPLTLTLVSGVDANGAGGSLTVGGSQTTLANIVNNAGTATIVYEVTTAADVAGTPSEAYIPVEMFATSLPAVGAPAVNIQVAPISTVLTSATLSATAAPVVRFVSRPITGAININSCITVLLYPFVTNKLGFDTGIAIANMGQDVAQGATAIVSAQSGTCVVSYWDGSTTGTTPVKAVTLGPIAAGVTQTILVSDATNGSPGFQGYAIGRCNFQYAHGFAIVVNGFGSAAAPTVGTAYLADVTSDTRPLAGGVESLGQ